MWINDHASSLLFLGPCAYEASWSMKTHCRTSLCPLDSRAVENESLIHSAHFYWTSTISRELRMALNKIDTDLCPCESSVPVSEDG